MGKIINYKEFSKEINDLSDYLVKRHLTTGEAKLILQRKIETIEHDSIHVCIDEEFTKRKL